MSKKQVRVVEAMHKAGVIMSHGEGRRLIQQGAVKAWHERLGWARVSNPQTEIPVGTEVVVGHERPRKFAADADTHTVEINVEDPYFVVEEEEPKWFRYLLWTVVGALLAFLGVILLSL